MRLNKFISEISKVAVLFLVGALLILVSACGNVQSSPADSAGSMSSSTNLLSGNSGAMPSKPDVLQSNQQTEIVIPGSGESAQDASFNSGQDSAPTETPIEGGTTDVYPAPALETGAETAIEPEPAQPLLVAAEDLPPTEPSIGFLAPDFTLQTLDGNTVQLSDLRGRPVMINYWTSWCVPCQEELPMLEKIFQDYQQQGFVVLSVNAIEQDNMDDVIETVNVHGLTYPVLLDHSEQIWTSYQVLFFPTSFFVDANGIIRDIVLGSSPEANFRTKVETLVTGSY